MNALFDSSLQWSPDGQTDKSILFTFPLLNGMKWNNQVPANKQIHVQGGAYIYMRMFGSYHDHTEFNIGLLGNNKISQVG